MDKKKRFLLIAFLFLFLFCLNESDAQIQNLGVFKTQSCITLKQTCANCSFINFSLSIPPNQSVILVNQSMGKETPNLWIYQFCNTSQNGEYIYDTYGDPDGSIVTSSVLFVVNPIGKILTTAQAGLYFLIFITSLLAFVFCLIAGIYLPSGNKRNEMTGYVIAVSNLKYVKYFMISVSYLILILIFYFGYIISWGYLDIDFLGSLFYFAFYFLMALLLPLFIVTVYVVIANAVRDQKVREFLSRGLKVR